MSDFSHEYRSGDALSPTDLRLLGNPIEFLAEDHLREREICTSLDYIAASESADQEVLWDVQSFLEKELPLHLADEEEDLFPMMVNRCEPEDEIERVIDRLLGDHDHAEKDTPVVIAILQEYQRGTALSPDNRKVLSSFATHSRHHLILENAIILPLARVRLTPDDLSHLCKRMLARRGLDSLVGGGEHAL